MDSLLKISRPTTASLSDRILVIDDDPEIQDLIHRYLDRQGYSIDQAFNGLDGLQLAQNEVDLVIVDLMMPGVDGLEVIRRLRQRSAVPILILTARGDEADRVTGLEIGADDYVTKPFSPRELLARVKALLRRSKVLNRVTQAPQLFHLDGDRRTVSVQGEVIDLTPREYELARILAANPGKNFTREELLNRVWGPEYTGDTRRVDVHISNLREKLGRHALCPIRSIWGVGYRFDL